MEFLLSNVFETILHFACRSDNLELVEYIVSLNEIEVDAKDVFLAFVFIMF